MVNLSNEPAPAVDSLPPAQRKRATIRLCIASRGSPSANFFYSRASRTFSHAAQRLYTTDNENNAAVGDANLVSMVYAITSSATEITKNQADLDFWLQSRAMQVKGKLLNQGDLLWALGSTVGAPGISSVPRLHGTRMF
jgi:hypothetical protein